MKNYLLISLILLGFAACKSDGPKVPPPAPPEALGPGLFTRLPSSETGVDFQNTIEESAEYNIFNYEYIYNGGGVTIGDINNDNLPDIYLSGTLVESKMYLNKGNFKFQDVTKESGLEAGGFKTGVSMVDINNDGWLDIFVCRTGKSENRNNLLYINNQDGHFTESAEKWGLKDLCHSNQAYFFDFDLDGDLDLFLVNHPVDFSKGRKLQVKQNEDGSYERETAPTTAYESDRLYKNNGNSFVDISKAAGIHNSAFGLSAAIADYNKDGYPDIFVANDYVSPDMLYINNKNGTFTDKIDDYFRHTSQHSMGSDVADYNNDGEPDLIVLDMIAESNQRKKMLMNNMELSRYLSFVRYGYGEQYMRNVLQSSNGGGFYSEIGQFSGTSSTDWSWAPLFADFDNDGWKDLFITNGYRRDITNLDYMKFTVDSLNKSGALGDISNLPAILELIPSEKLQNYIFKNNQKGQFDKKSIEWGIREKSFSNGAAYADLDNDGDLDIVVNNIDEEAFVYKNNQEKKGGHHIRFVLKGPKENVKGYGAEVRIKAGGLEQVQELYSSRGFFSGVEPVLHFGLGSATTVEEIWVRWPDGQRQSLQNIQADQVYTIDYQPDGGSPEARKTSPLLQDISKKSGFNFLHQENDFIDFQRESLIPRKYSTEGPALAKGDFNGDGQEDVFIGAAAGFEAAVYLRNGNTLQKTSTKAFLEDKQYEDAAAIAFDADADGDLDLYVCSGGSAMPEGHASYQDRLYLNDGKAGWKKASKALPAILGSTAAVAAADFDADGDIDLFVGGSILPGKYPLSPESFLLQNNDGTFADITKTVAPALVQAGLVSDATWADVNGDNTPDLILVGEWNRVRVFENKDGRLSERSGNGLEKSSGWWLALQAADLDGDGDEDLVLGGMGANIQVKVAENEPLELYCKDFDENGSFDPILTHYIDGESWPLADKDQIMMQIPMLKSRFPRYKRFSTAKIENIFTESERASVLKLQAFHMNSAWLENDGKGSFSWHELPAEAQKFPTRDIAIADLNQDGILDLILVGNAHEMNVKQGKLDAGNGLVLLGGSNGFEVQLAKSSGLYAPENAREICILDESSGNPLFIVANNAATPRVFKKKQ